MHIELFCGLLKGSVLGKLDPLHDRWGGQALSIMVLGSLNALRAGAGLSAVWIKGGVQNSVQKGWESGLPALT